MIPPQRDRHQIRVEPIKRVGWLGDEKPTVYTWEGVYRNYYGIETEIKFSWNAEKGKLYVDVMMGGSFKRADGTAIADHVQTLFLRDREKHIAAHDTIWKSTPELICLNPLTYNYDGTSGRTERVWSGFYQGKRIRLFHIIRGCMQELLICWDKQVGNYRELVSLPLDDWRHVEKEFRQNKTAWADFKKAFPES